MKRQILLAIVAAVLICSCATIPRVKCQHTISIPVTVIGLDSIPRTVYLPFCDTLRQLPPKKIKP